MGVKKQFTFILFYESKSNEHVVAASTYLLSDRWPHRRHCLLCVFTVHHKLTAVARNVVKSCKHEVRWALLLLSWCFTSTQTIGLIRDGWMKVVKEGDYLPITTLAWNTNLLTYIHQDDSCIKPVLNWANCLCAKHTSDSSMKFLNWTLVCRTLCRQFDELCFILNWLIMRCKLRPKLVAEARQTAWYKM